MEQVRKEPKEVAEEKKADAAAANEARRKEQEEKNDAKKRMKGKNKPSRRQKKKQTNIIEVGFLLVASPICFSGTTGSRAHGRRQTYECANKERRRIWPTGVCIYTSNHNSEAMVPPSCLRVSGSNLHVIHMHTMLWMLRDLIAFWQLARIPLNALRSSLSKMQHLRATNHLPVLCTGKETGDSAADARRGSAQRGWR